MVEKKRIFRVLCDCTIAFKFFGRIRKRLKVLRMYDLKMNSALVGAANAWDDVGSLIPARLRVYYLLPQRILIVVINEKIRAKSVTKERVVVLKNDFYRIF